MNEFENNKVTGRYTLEKIEDGIQNIGESCDRVIAISTENAETIIEICNSLLAKIKEEKDAQKEIIRKIVSKYSADKIREHIERPIKKRTEMKIKERRKQ